MSSEIDATRPRLYSIGAIRVFAFLFSSIAGGLMLYQNLRTLGHPAAARQALWSGILFTVSLTALMTLIPVIGRLSLPLNLFGSLMLGAYYQKLVPDYAQYPRKSIAGPLLICLPIATLLILLALLK